MKSIKSFYLPGKLTKDLWIKPMLKKNMDLDCIKGVLYLEMNWELWILKALMLKLVVVLIVTALQKWDGLKFLRLRNYRMELLDFTMLLEWKLSMFSILKEKWSIHWLSYGPSQKINWLKKEVKYSKRRNIMKQLIM